jgi:hypothetical protein
MSEQIGTKVRGKSQASLDLVEAMYEAAEAAQPITGRGVGYKLFAAGLIPSMDKNEMKRVYRLHKMMTDGHSSLFTSVTMTRPACSCRSKTSPPGLRNTNAIMLSFGALR